MSTPISIQAAITCGGEHKAATRPRLTLALPARLKRSQFEIHARAYAEGKGWSVHEPDMHEVIGRAASSQKINDWRCPDCSKAANS